VDPRLVDGAVGPDPLDREHVAGGGHVVAVGADVLELGLLVDHGDHVPVAVVGDADQGVVVGIDGARRDHGQAVEARREIAEVVAGRRVGVADEQVVEGDRVHHPPAIDGDVGDLTAALVEAELADLGDLVVEGIHREQARAGVRVHDVADGLAGEVGVHREGIVGIGDAVVVAVVGRRLVAVAVAGWIAIAIAIAVAVAVAVAGRIAVAVAGIAITVAAGITITIAAG